MRHTPATRKRMIERAIQLSAEHGITITECYCNHKGKCSNCAAVAVAVQVYRFQQVRQLLDLIA